MDNSEDDGGDDDDDDLQIQDDENEDFEDDGGSDDDDALIFEGNDMYSQNDDGEEEVSEDDGEEVQLDEGLHAGQFEMMDDSLVNEDMAVEMEQLQYRYRPHDFENIALNNLDEPTEDNYLQLNDDNGPKYFTAEMDGHSSLGEAVYERVVPSKYADGGDNFMASMIQNYALEGKNEDGTPNGKFFMNEAITKQAAAEILKTHKKLEGKELDDYMNQYFARTFAHFDVTKDGILGVEVMPQFMRFLASDQAMQLD